MYTTLNTTICSRGTAWFCYDAAQSMGSNERPRSLSTRGCCIPKWQGLGKRQRDEAIKQANEKDAVDDAAASPGHGLGLITASEASASDTTSLRV